MIFFCHVCVKIALPVSVFTFSTPAYLYLRFPYLHFPPLQFVLRFFVLAYSIPRYLRFTCIFSRPISAPRLGVYYFFVVDSVCLYVRLCVCLSVTDKLQIASFFCLSMESSHFWPTVLHVALYETVFLDFDLGSLTQKFTPPNLHKIAYDSASTADIQAVWAYYGVFGDGRFNATMQNDVGPTPVVKATKYRLGAEIQSPTGLYFFCWQERQMFVVIIMVLPVYIGSRVVESHEVPTLHSNTITSPQYNDLVPAYIARRKHVHAHQPEVVIGTWFLAPHRRKDTRRVT